MKVNILRKSASLSKTTQQFKNIPSLPVKNKRTKISNNFMHSNFLPKCSRPHAKKRGDKIKAILKLSTHIPSI